jgi:tetratricopeptide (TPR) repeat protein
MTPKIVAFVAKSFDPSDEAKIAPIEKLLESFRRLGFIVQSADRSEVESVSKKVRSLIDESDVFVGIFTKRHPVYQFKGRWATAISALRGPLNPSVWSAPPWVLQESGYALKGNKALILFRETDVEIPGLQGDLEYVLYDPLKPVAALHRANEMITGIIAKAGSVKVETVVRLEVSETKETTAAPPKPSEAKPKTDEATAAGEDVGTYMREMFAAVSSRDWELAERKYEAGLKWVLEHQPAREVAWKSLYLDALFIEGRTDALDQLRDLAAQNPSEYLPQQRLGSCLVTLHEYDEAVKCYLEAASVAKPDRRASLEIQAAEVLQMAKKPKQAKEALLRLRDSDYAKKNKTQFRILELLYSLAKGSEDLFGSFAIGELALRQSPEEIAFRFSLAYDYESGDQSHMSLYHYKIICEHDEKYPSALNNFGVSSAKSGLAVLAAQRYKRAYELGETLAASNLAHKYLEGGFSEDAIALLKNAQTKENCVPDVARTLAAVHERIEENDREQEKVLGRADEHREFLLAFADGLLSPTATNLGGPWSFPSMEITLECKPATLEGTKEKRTEVEPAGFMNVLFPGSAPKSVTRIERFEFSGALSGRTCKFKLQTNQYDEPSSWTVSGAPSSSTIEGYIVFAQDGRSGQVTELNEGKPEKYYSISKFTPKALAGP